MPLPTTSAVAVQVAWGARDWNSFHHWKWFSGQAGPDLTYNALQILAEGREWTCGHVNRAGTVRPIVEITSTVEYDDDFTQRRGKIDLTDSAGKTVRIEAERFSLLRFDPSDQITMHEAACRASVDGQTGLLHFEMGWTKDYIAHQVAARRASAPAVL